MQQDDKNTFKFLHNIMKPDSSPISPPSKSNSQSNLIERLNLLQQGMNYIAPSFWYEQLMDLNHETNKIKNIQYPSFETYVNFLSLCNIQKATKCKFSAKYLFPKQSALFSYDLLNQSNYLNSKTLHFCKINNFIQSHQIQWALINPHLWDLIQSKYQLQRIKLLNQQKQVVKSSQRINRRNKRQQIEQIPKIGIFITKQFILQKGRPKGKQNQNEKNKQNIKLVYKNVKYTIPNSQINEQINNQLRLLSRNQINLILITEKSIKKSTYYKKLNISGYLSEKIGFKQLIKSLMEIEQSRKIQSLQKYYIYDIFGQKLSHKIATIKQFIQIANNKLLICSTTPLNQIMNASISYKRNLDNFIQKEFNFPQQSYDQLFDIHKKQQDFIQPLQINFNRLSKQKQIKYLIKNIKKSSQQTKKLISSGFRPFNNKDTQTNQIKILNGTFYRSQSQQEMKQQRNYQNNKLNKSNGSNKQSNKSNNRQSNKSNNRQNNEDVRYLDSVTTNLDTPYFDIQNQSEKVNSQKSSYTNKRLHRHSAYNRTQRKRKAQNYIQKKKKNNYIIRSNTNILPQNQNYQSFDYKKRIKHVLLKSLQSLEDDQQTVNYLIDNMRKVALQSIYLPQQQLIKHPFLENHQSLKDETNQKYNKTQSQQLKQSFQTTDTKKYPNKNLNRKINKKQSKQQALNKILRQKVQKSLLQISNAIQRKYEPQLLKSEQYEKLGLEKLQEQYQQLIQYKKDNEQIKTIIDNSQGPYSQAQKQNLKIKYPPQKALQINYSDSAHHEIQSISDDGGINPIQDNQQTI